MQLLREIGRRLGPASLTLFLVLGVSLTAPAVFAQKKDKDTTSKDQDKDEKDPDDDGLYSCKKARGRFKVNLKDEVELKDLISWAMSFRCENFIYGTGVGGRSAKVIMVTPKEMSARQAWQVWQVALQNMNLTWVKKGNVIEIVEAPQAKRQALPVYSAATPGSDRVVRALIRPTHLPMNELAAILTELKSKDGEVKALTNAGIIVVTDFGSHIAKMKQIVRAIDQRVSGEQLWMIKVHNADATELADKLGELLGTKEQGSAATPAPTSSSRASRRRRRNRDNTSDSTSTSPTATTVETTNVVPSKIIAEERTNSLIVLASEAAYRRVRSLVKRLDIAIDVEGGGRIHVYVLQHADAEELATTLTTLITGAQRPQTGTGNQRNRQQQRRPTTPSSATPGADAFEGQVRVTHDAPTNSLVIVASVKDFLAVRQVIRRLDTPRLQVYIEATIAEINVDNTRSIGFSYHGGAGVADGGLGFAGFQTSDLSTIAVGLDPTQLVGISGLFGGVLGPLIEEAEELLGVSIPSFGLLFQALATNSNVNVLSSPHIMTTDNQEAEISVGQNIPYQAGQVGLPGAAGGVGGLGFQSVQRQDVALTLKVTPQINASDNVRLDIDLEISDIASPDFNGFGPSWARRTIKDTVVVKDQESVVIGGLMQDRSQVSESKIPLLGDIPVLGYLFKYQSKSKVKTNLLVMLTPYVIKEQGDLIRIKERRLREQREFAKTFASFRNLDKDEQIDYRRKRGLLEEINKSITKVDREIEIRRELENRLVEFPDGAIEVGGDADVDEEGDDGEGEEADDKGADKDAAPKAGQ